SIALLAAGGDVALDAPERPFVVVDHGQHPRSEREDLPNELAADRPSATRHGDRCAVDRGGDGIEVDLDGRPSQQVLDADGADALDLVAAGDEVAQGWNRLDGDAHLVRR